MMRFKTATPFLFWCSFLIDPCSAQRAALSLGANVSAKASNGSDRNQNLGNLASSEGESVSEAITLAESLQRCEVGFEGIELLLQSKKKRKIILDGSIKGKALPGRMLAVMGPSGSGKTSILNAIAGQVAANKNVNLSGKRYINNEPLSGDSMLPAAFIKQEVNFFPHMTVKETLEFRVDLMVGKKMGKSARNDIVTSLMDLVGLGGNADTIVGDSKIRGLSGGEKKRLSIACEMISSPPIILLDEPTSGLDSYQAAQVIKFLRKLADTGKTIIAVIHQPSQQVFSMFDDLLLVSEGRQMYFGEVSEVRSYFTKLGYGASMDDIGTAEHVLDVISRTFGGQLEKEESTKRLETIAKEAISLSSNVKVSSSDVAVLSKRYRNSGLKNPSANIFRQFRLLLSRSFKDIIRGKASIIIKIVQQVSLAVIYGGIYKLGDNQASVMDRYGLLSLIAIGGMNMAVATTIRTFPKEKAIISSEMASGMYRSLPYFVAKALSEFPLAGIFSTLFGIIIYPLTGLQKKKFKTFIGINTLHTLTAQAVGLLISSISPNSDVALSLLPPVIVLNIIFDGKNISEENTPKFLRWIAKFGLIRWAFEGFAINEFTGLNFSTKGPRKGPSVNTGLEALDRFGLADKTVLECITAQRNILSVCWVLSYFGLSLTKEKFMVMGSK